MRTLLALLAASTLIGGCGCAEVNYLRVDDGASAAPDEVNGTTVVPVDVRVNPGLWMYPGTGASVTEMCGTQFGGNIRCGDLLNLCSPPNSPTDQWTSVFMPATFGCEDGAIAWDVCHLRPEVEWSAYGLTPDECASAPSGPRP